MKKIMALIGAMSLLLTGCGEAMAEDEVIENTDSAVDVQEEETEKEIVPTEAKIAEKAVEDTEEESVEEESEEENTTYSVKLVNSTGKDINGLSVKTGSETDYPQNLLEEVFAVSSDYTLVYTPDSAKVTNQDSNTPLISEEYLVKLSFADGTESELHQFPFSDIESGEIFLEDDIAYIVYTSVSAGEINTKEAEKMTRELAEVAVINGVEEPVTEAETEPEPIIEPDNSETEVTEPYLIEEPVYEEPVYEEPVQEEPVYEEPVQEEPDYYEEPVQEEPVDPNSGCLGGGALFN